MTRLMVNIETVSWLRRQQEGRVPEPVSVATALEAAGAQGIALGMPSKPDDEFRKEAWLLKEVITTHLNIVLRPAESTVRTALKLQPTMVTLTAPKKSGSHLNAPLPVVSDTEELTKWIQELRATGTVVSCFIKPHLDHVKAAARIGADYVEFDTQGYADAEDAAAEQAALDELAELAQAAHKLGLGISAGNRLSYDNVAEISRLPHMECLHVGTAVISRGLLIGVGQAIRDMIDVIHRS